MRPRAIKDLSQLPNHALFGAAAEGLQHILHNAQRLYNDSQCLAENHRSRGTRVLHTIAEEEASKFLILVDAIRCPRVPADRWTRQLARFNDHLAKGLYSRSCLLKPATLGQLQDYLDTYRQEFFLDGPNDVDWIFRNEIESQREETLYVDYVETEAGHLWLHPSRYEHDDGTGFIGLSPNALRMSEALANSGVSTPDGLCVVAEVWHQVEMRRDLTWPEIRKANIRTLEELEKKSLLHEQPSEVYGDIINNWQFPMYDLDLTKTPVDKAVLRRRQENWVPDF